MLDEMHPLLQGNIISNRTTKGGHRDPRTVRLGSSTKFVKGIIIICNFCVAQTRRRRLQGEASIDGRVLDDGTKLLAGVIVTRSNVGEYADLSRDICVIRTYGKNGDTQRLTTLYQEGFHAVKTTTDG